MSKTSSIDDTRVEWNTINWRKLVNRVYKLQKRIYQASNRGDVKAVRRLQKTRYEVLVCKMYSGA